MKIDALCQSCGQRFPLGDVQPGNDDEPIPCPSCGKPMNLAEDIPAPFPENLTNEAVPAAAAAERAVPEKHAGGVVCPRCGLHFQPTGERAETARRELRTVLFVLDDDYFLEIAQNALQPRFQTRTARDFDGAWRLLSGKGIDLLVLDPEFGGGIIGRSLLQQLKSKPCPILIFTAWDESEMYGVKWKELQSMGADDLVIKAMNAGDSLLHKACELLECPYGEDEIE